MKTLVDDINKGTNGAYTVQCYFGSTLYNEAALVTALPSGTCKMARIDLGAGWPGLAPTLSALTPAYLGTRDQMLKAVDGDFGQEIQKALEKIKVKIIGYSPTGPTDVICNRTKKITAPDDMKGLIIRAPNDTFVRLVEDCGGAPTQLASSETYTALQRGTIDGTVTNSDTVLTRKFDEVVKYITITPIQAETMFGIVLNLDFWNSIPKNYQDVFLSSARKYDLAMRAASLAQSQMKVDTLKQNPKIEVTVLTDAQNKVFQEKVLPGQIQLLAKVLGQAEATRLVNMITAK